MGMSASQARLLAITSRMNDIELRSQQIANTKLRLADESDQVAQKYTNALNANKITMTKYDKKGNTSQVSLKPSNLPKDYRLVDVKTNKKVTSASITSSQMYEMIQSGQYRLEKNQDVTDDNGKTKKDWAEVSIASDPSLGIASDDSKFALAEAEYNAATQKINNKEKKLDQQLKTMDTEHSALQTEQDSVKSLIKDNVDKSFNLFS